VLIIDDHELARAVVRELLERRGFAVVGEADSVKAGLEAFETTAPDAVLLDINLPDGSGLEVCRALTAADPDLAVLLMSADPGHEGWPRDCGAVAFVPKSQLGSVDLAGLLGGEAAGGVPDRAVG
jgi:DNA-binding NarL/FixJ family response regulator